LLSSINETHIHKLLIIVMELHIWVDLFEDNDDEIYEYFYYMTYSWIPEHKCL
jgi:hypothetical protein